MNAARILADAGVDSEELRAELSPVRPEDVNVWPAGRPIRLAWRSGVRAVTMGRLVLADPDVMNGDPRDLARLVVHELVHVRQFARMGYLRFMTRYVLEYLTGRLRGQDHRDAYTNIGAEVEAREIADRHVRAGVT